jgi:4,5-DOPA dioxygenase extradiol
MASRRGARHPAIFVSHGSPMTALDQGPYAKALAAFGESVRPEAIVVISAHWQEAGIRIASAARPELIYDFGGFPRELYQLKYGAPGSPELAAQVAAELRRAGFESVLDEHRGWDHGVWVPLRLMFPSATVPVVAVSLPVAWSPEQLHRLGQALGGLREKGALILGSGGIVHNLRLMNWAEKDAPVDPWAREFQEWVRDAVARRDLASLFGFEKLAPHARRAVPTAEHFVPLFPVLGAAGDYRQVVAIFEGFEHGNMSMYSFQLLA